MNIVFATSGLDFNGDTLNRGSLGGSETALASMAREFARLGHRVLVYCRCSQPGEFEGVIYADVEDYLHQCRNLTIDVQIVSRFGHLWHPEINAGINMWWLHDMPSAKEETMMYALKPDVIALLSDYHINCFKLSGAPIDPIVWKTANGVDTALISKLKAASPKHPARFLYTSLPERGLDRLITDIWPRIKSSVPNAELVVAGYDLSSISHLIKDDVRRQQGQILERAASTDGVKFVGPLNKSTLYSLMKSCTAMLYPTAWPEIFCITAVEAQACGLPIVTTNSFALSETVGPDSGVLVDPGPKYTEEFVKAAVQLSRDNVWRDQLAAAGPKFVEQQGYVWSRIAKQWETKFESMFRDRRTTQRSRVVSAMVRSGDNFQAVNLSSDNNVDADNTNGHSLLLTVDDKLPSKLLNEADREVIWNLVLGVWRHHTNLEGKRILNCSGCSEFEEFIKKEVPSVEVFGFTGEDDGAKFDAVFIGDEMSSSAYPHATLGSYQACLKDDGFVLSSTPVGRLSLQKDWAQLWSFTSDDLRALAKEMHIFGSIFAHIFNGDRGEREGYWITCFGGPGKPAKINLAQRVNRFRPEQTLSVCMIGKDEEKWVNMSLSEVKDIADEIIFCDCHSSDRTAELAARNGADVYEIDFEDFAQARNESLERALGDWILVLDCDERLVNGDRIRKFLNYALPQSYTLRQNHLIVDGKKDCDTPIRLFRNVPHYRYVGKIHEHCEDLSDPTVLSKAIQPAFEIVDVDIAHYGYVHEQHRRKKALLRNMDLLIEDARVNLPKGRTITLVLAVRDYLNAVKWHFRHVGAQTIAPDSFEHELLEAVIDTYHAKFDGADSGFENVVRPMYQEACAYLSANGLMYRRTKLVPFQTVLALTGDHKPIKQQDVAKVRPQTAWFIHPDELRAFLDNAQGQLGSKMFKGYHQDSKSYEWEFNPPYPDPVNMLTRIRELYKRG
jgi:glycosyltransferase involved in cell wall biosynthesis